jgi:hypothetical protein
MLCRAYPRRVQQGQGLFKLEPKPYNKTRATAQLLNCYKKTWSTGQLLNCPNPTTRLGQLLNCKTATTRLGQLVNCSTAELFSKGKGCSTAHTARTHTSYILFSMSGHCSSVLRKCKRKSAALYCANANNMLLLLLLLLLLLILLVLLLLLL